jgi:nucleoid-associated protein YgaU
VSVRGKGGGPRPEATGTLGKKAAKKAAEKAASEAKGLRKHLKRVERQLADATRQEARRGRRLEKARVRTERLAAEVERARSAAAAKSGGTATAEEPAGTTPKRKRSAKAGAQPKAEAEPPASAAGPVAAEPTAPVTRPVEAFCLRERKHVQMVNPTPMSMSNGAAALSGTCVSCGATLYKLVRRAGR